MKPRIDINAPPYNTVKLIPYCVTRGTIQCAVTLKTQMSAAALIFSPPDLMRRLYGWSAVLGAARIISNKVSL